MSDWKWVPERPTESGEQINFTSPLKLPWSDLKYLRITVQVKMYSRSNEESIQFGECLLPFSLKPFVFNTLKRTD